MVKLFKALLLILGFITGCMPIMIEAPLVSSVSIVSDQLIVTGQGFININELTLSDPQTGFKKTFEVASVSGSQIVGTAVNSSKVPVPSLLNLIIDSAQGQTTYPVNFSLQNNAVTNPTIKNEAITPLKFKGVTANPSITSVLTFNPATGNFFFAAPSGGGGGGSGVDAIAYGEGIVGDGNIATGTVDISVNVGVKGSTTSTFIPYFNSQNKIVMDSSSATSTDFSGLQFKDSSGNFDIFNDGALKIQDVSNNDLLVLDYNGDLDVKGVILSNGNAVCTTAGNCPGSPGTYTVTATLPLVAVASGTTSVNISPGAVNTANNLVKLDSSGKLPAVDGSLLTNIPTMATSSTAVNYPILSGGNNKSLVPANYTIPSSSCTNGQILKSDGTNFICADDPSGVTSFNGRAGVVTPTSGDYTATQITNDPFFPPSGNIDATNVQAAINELDSEKLSLTGGTLTGTIILGPGASSTTEEQFLELATNGNNHVGFRAPNVIANNVIWTLPSAEGASGTVLTTDGSNVLSWTTVSGGGAGSGDVVGPATSTLNTLAQFSDSTGKNIKGTPWTIPINMGSGGQYLSVSGSSSLVWTSLPTTMVQVGGAPVIADNLTMFGGSAGTQLIDSKLAARNVPTMVAVAATNTIILSGGTGKTLNSTDYTMSPTIGSATYVLKSDGTNAIWQADEVGLTGSGLIGNLPVFGLLPSVMEDSGILLANIPTMASGASAQYQPILSGGINKSQIAAPYTLPNTTCLPGEVLKWNTTGFDCQSDPGAPGLTQWVKGKNYKTGAIVNSGSDKNWLFKVIQDHTSDYEPRDVSAGNLLVISPPIITTGIQDGGVVSLVGDMATISSGTGFIAKYGTSPSPFPLITIVEWGPQTIQLIPPTGIYTLYINEFGVLVPRAGYSDSKFSAENISVALVDMNLGKAFDRETYPTNPVGQLRSLSFFFGGMTKGLSYLANGLQLTRSAHENYFWGANADDPYDPNTKTSTATSPVTFYEFKQNGLVDPTIKTDLQNNVYDKNGTLTSMGPNKWGFIRIYSTLGEDDYVMYSQDQYQTEADAKNAAVSANFKKPIDLELTKFSSWFVFQEGDSDFSNNPITTCEPFGCDKIGTTAGGGGGDVFGPSSAASNTVPIFAGTSGKILVASNFIPPAATGTDGQVLTANSDGTTKWGTLAVAPTRASLPSDKKLKKEIKNLPEGYIDRLMELRPVSFVWRDNESQDIGFIAQEVSNVFPDLVEKNDDYLGINYSKLVVPIVKAFQEQQGEIKAFRSKVQKDEQTIKMLLERIERLEKIIGEEAKK